MNNVHVNDVFNVFEMTDTQSQRVLGKITQTPQKSHSITLQRKPLVAVCSLLVVVALLFGIFPTITKDNQDNLTFAFTGLTITAYAAEIGSGVITFDIELFDKFDRVEITVSNGTISTGDNTASATQSIVLSKSGKFIWHYGEIENAKLSFQAFGVGGNVLSEGSLDMSSGEFLIISSYPQRDNTINVNEAGIDVESLVLDKLQQDAEKLADEKDVSIEEKSEKGMTVIFDFGDEAD